MPLGETTSGAFRSEDAGHSSDATSSLSGTPHPGARPSNSSMASERGGHPKGLKPADPRAHQGSLQVFYDSMEPEVPSSAAQSAATGLGQLLSTCPGSKGCL